MLVVGAEHTFNSLKAYILYYKLVELTRFMCIQHKDSLATVITNTVSMVAAWRWYFLQLSLGTLQYICWCTVACAISKTRGMPHWDWPWAQCPFWWCIPHDWQPTAVLLVHHGWLLTVDVVFVSLFLSGCRLKKCMCKCIFYFANWISIAKCYLCKEECKSKHTFQT